MKESFGTPSFLPCSPSFSSSFCPIASFAQTTTEPKCVDSPSKTSGDAPRQSMRADHLAVSGKTPNKAWRETNILYPRATKERLSGKKSLKCTLGQPVLSEMAYYALNRESAVEQYISRISRQKSQAFLPESTKYANLAIIWHPQPSPEFGAHSHCRRKAASKKAPRGLSLLCLRI